MRVFGLLGLVLALLVVGLLVRKQMGVQVAPIAASVPAASAPAGSVRDQSRQIQQQFKQSLDAASQPRTVPDE